MTQPVEEFPDWPESKGTSWNGLSFFIDTGRASGVELSPAFFVYLCAREPSVFEEVSRNVCDRAVLRRAVTREKERVVSLQAECFALFYDLHDLRRRHVLIGRDVEGMSAAVARLESEQPRSKKARVGSECRAVVERRLEDVARRISDVSAELDLKVDQTVIGLGTSRALEAISYGTAGKRGDVFFREHVCQRVNLAAGRNVNTRDAGDEIDVPFYLD